MCVLEEKMTKDMLEQCGQYSTPMLNPKTMFAIKKDFFDSRFLGLFHEEHEFFTAFLFNSISSAWQNIAGNGDLGEWEFHPFDRMSSGQGTKKEVLTCIDGLKKMDILQDKGRKNSKRVCKLNAYKLFNYQT